MQNKILIVGFGRIAKRHVQNLNMLYPEIEIAIFSRHSTETNLKVISDMEEALRWEPKAALLTNPASAHVETGLILAQKGIHLFIEKPISDRLDGIAQLIAICNRNSLTLMVGYNFRFHAPLQILKQALNDHRIGRPLSIKASVGQYLPLWRPDRDYRNVVSAQKKSGGGVVLELSHELDYARSLVGEVKSVNARLDHLSDLEIDVEDSAEIILQFENGVIGNIHLDMTDQAVNRSLRIVGTKGTLTWDGITNQVQRYSPEEKKWIELLPAEKTDGNEMYCSEIRHFMDCVTTGNKCLVTGEEGLRVLEIALAIKKSSEEKRTIVL